MSVETEFPAAFEPIFERLKRIYVPLAPSAVVTAESRDNYQLNTPYTEQYKKELYLGGVQMRKNYVSFYLMPVYIFPELLSGISPELEKHRQGKSCFNFKRMDEHLFLELEALVEKGAQRFRQEGFLSGDS